MFSQTNVKFKLDIKFFTVNLKQSFKLKPENVIRREVIIPI